jgi:transposase
MARVSLQLPELTEAEQARLISYARMQKGERRIALRSQLILDWISGLTYKQSAHKNGVAEAVVTKWRKRFSKDKFDGLVDRKRPGKPPTITEAQRNHVIHLACQTTTSGTQKYSQHDIATQIGISQSQVSNILRQSELKPHKTDYWCGKSPDPEFEKKMIEIVGLYLNPPENALVLSVDEKTQIQALDRTQPELPMRKGNPRRLTNTYKRNGTVNLIAALAVETGEITARNMDKNNTDNFLKFLKYLDRKYRNVQLHLVLDNLSIHKNQKVKDWLKNKRKIHLHFTPTYSSWLNQIEIWFGIMTRDILKDGVWHSKKQLVDQLMSYIKEYNENKAKPFKWSYGEKYITN